MRSHIHIDNLRGADPKTLEILIQDAIRKPMLQLSHQTLADLVALSEVEELPRGLRRDLGAFAGRVGQEIADLPDGSAMKNFLAGFDEVDARIVPSTIRDYIAREVEREARDPRDRELAQGLLEKWEGAEPEPVSLGTVEPRIQRADAVAPPESDEKPTRGSKPRKPRAASSPAQTHEDAERSRWIAATALEKLTQYREKGLAETVLVAGIRKEAAELYPDLMPYEITKVLRGLQDNGQVRRSAGRWSRMGRFW